MKKVIEKVKNFFIKLGKNEHFKAFMYIFLIGLVCFSIEAATNHFTLPLSGDYTLQTYSFYSQGYHVFWNFIKTGQYPLFDFSNYLGANYLGTQSFYYVFSPLFYLLCLCPESLLFQGIFFHMVFKFALGGFFMYLLLRKYFHVSFKMSWVGGFIYAFSGWALFYLWFHFGDVMAFFPLFIMGIEKCLKERKGWLLTVGTFLCGLSNYFFLVNFLIFGVVYAFYRWIYIYGINKKRGYDIKTRYGVLLQGILYCGIGIMISGICLFPSLAVASATNRTQTSTNYFLQLLQTVFVSPERIDGKYVFGDIKSFKDIFEFGNLKSFVNTLFIWEDRGFNNFTATGKQSIGYILSNWIYMNTSCWDNIMFSNPDLDNSLGGFFITTPLTLLLIPSIVQAVKTKRPWTIFGIIMCLLLPFLPITSHIAFGFTSLYGRWQLWIVLIGILFIIPTLDRFEKVNRRLVTLSLILNYTFAIIVYFISKKDGRLPTSDVTNFLGIKIPGLLFLAIIELIIMFIVWAIYRFKFFKPAMVKRLMTMIVVLEIGISTVVTIEHKGYANWETFYLSQDSYAEMIDVISDIQKEDKDFYRIMNTEATRITMNLPAELNYNGASAFNSTYDFELDEFKNRSLMAYGGGWTMGNHEKKYWLDQYLGTKYYIIDKKDKNNDNNEYHRDLTEFYDGRTSKDEEKQEYNLNLGWNYSLYKEYEYYDVYKNDNYIGIGYTVDDIIDENFFKNGNGLENGIYKDYKIEEMYASTAIIESEDFDWVKENSSEVKIVSSYNPIYNIASMRAYWNVYFSPRDDMVRDENNYWKPREKYLLTSYNKNDIIKYLPSNNQFFHKRWEEHHLFGDQFILELKDGFAPLADKATKDNMCFLTLQLKLGPKMLVSLYHGDKLITQDAHMHSNNSLSKEDYEWKLNRGFYVDEPIDKVVIEFLADTSFDQFFSARLPGLRDFEFSYAYQNEIDKLQKVVNDSLLTDVKYSNNKFTFKSHTNAKKVAVTNIPYDSGWTLKMNGEKQKIIKVNGGFVGFITDDKEANYELSYFTPGLKTGLESTGLGVLFFILLMFLYKKKTVNILSVEQQVNNIYLQKQEEEEKRYFKKHEEYVQSIIDRIKDKFTKKENK